MNYTYKELEEAVLARNPLLKGRLQPGLSQKVISVELKKKGITGFVDPIIQMYSWKNGTRINWELRGDEASFFPHPCYAFMKLDVAITRLLSFYESRNDQPRLAELVGRYFPPFWDGSMRWLAVDLNPHMEGRVVAIDIQGVVHEGADELVRVLYSSFDEFIADVIRANRENDSLAPFA